MENNKACEKLYPKILRFISSQPRSQKEVTDRAKKYLQKTILTEKEKTLVLVELIERLEYEKLINDISYADEFVYSIARSTKPRGSQYVKRFLIKKGVAPDIIESALSEFSQEDEYSQAMSAGTKKLTGLKYKNPYDAKNKIWGYLTRQGFRSDIIGRVVDNIIDVK